MWVPVFEEKKELTTCFSFISGRWSEQMTITILHGVRNLNLSSTEEGENAFLDLVLNKETASC